jgi:hypothetical protein
LPKFGPTGVVLQLICTHLVGEAKAAAFLRQVEDNASPKIFQARERKAKLVAAVAAPGAEYRMVKKLKRPERPGTTGSSRFLAATS